MRILAIETSCDETAISIVEAKGGFNRPAFSVKSHLISSQIAIHKQWGGVVPMIAKREHGKALAPLLLQALRETELLRPAVQHGTGTPALKKKIEKILEREPELFEQFREQIFGIRIPPIDAIAVTQGPGLEPALWVGINFARALSLLWNKPLIPTNHLEGHIYSSITNEPKPAKLFPAIALLISGGHTELVLVKDWLSYKKIGGTRDDAVGEAFDKVARLLDLPYPGGPEISRLAEGKVIDEKYKLPRPMLTSGDFDFSFSGLKTAVLYLVKKLGKLSDADRKGIAYEFQQAAIEVLTQKTLKAIEKFNAHSLIVGGGVISNRRLREALAEKVGIKFPETKVLIPDPNLSTDNATMIAVAAYFRFLKKGLKNPGTKIVAKGTMPLK